MNQLADPTSTPHHADRQDRIGTLVYAAAIGLGAFLLFQVQPLISKIILPWFGGSPAVWTTCMLFFQVALLGGYFYADRLRMFSSFRRQLMVHGFVLMLACATMPISRAQQFRPIDSSHPTARILGLLASTVGFSYFVLATTGPLIQSWYARAVPNKSPYRFYALSNLGSLGALISFPMIEPFLTTRWLAWSWSVGFVVYVLIVATLICKVSREFPHHEPMWSMAPDIDPVGSRETTANERANTPPISASTSGVLPWKSSVAWMMWSTLASAMLLSVTHQLCQNISVIPFLWVVPLSLYLLTFIICFDSDRWYVPRMYGVIAVGLLVWIAKILLAQHTNNSVWYFEPEWMQTLVRNQLGQMATYTCLLFFVCMICHGEVARTKPAPQHLTRYYLLISFGGALGGLLISLVCPFVFADFAEFNLLLALSMPLCLYVVFQDARQYWFSRPLLRRGYIGLATMATVTIVVAQLYATRNPAVASTRSFFGVMTVTSTQTPEMDAPAMRLYSGAPMHGSKALHGYQYQSPTRRRDATTYYSQNSGVGLAMRTFPRQSDRVVGVIGLGVGTLATYSRPGDVWRFYELNPDVERLARGYFTYLSDAEGAIQVILGDGRLSLERESPQHFDMLVIDAFTGDAIPTHLLTREACATYLEKHLKPDGLLAVHISNRHVDLAPTVARMAAEFDWPCYRFSNSDGPDMAFASDWMLISRNELFWQEAEVSRLRISTDVGPDVPLWTDDYHNLFQLLWRGVPSRMSSPH